MRARRTPDSNHVFSLPDGTEDNDLWCQLVQDEEGLAVTRSVWELTDQEREEIAGGANVELYVWGRAHPPVSMGTAFDELGKGDSNGDT